MNKIILGIAVLALIVAGVALVGGNQSGPATGISMSDTSNVTSFGIFPKNSTIGVQVLPSSGNLATATGTLFYLKSPFGATSTVTYLNIDESSAPSASVAAITYTCGTTTVPGAAPTATLISSGAVATSTKAYLTNGIGFTGTAGTPGNGNTRIGVGPNEYVACYITTASSTAANAAIAGTYKMLWVR